MIRSVFRFRVLCFFEQTVSLLVTLVPKPGTMAMGVGLALPEPLQDGDARSWFKWFEVCAAANEWNDQKKLLRLPTLLRG